MRANPNNFDVIILNFPKNPAHYFIHPAWGPLPYDDKAGADYIERNALVLVKLIRDINAELAANGSTEKLIVIGPSMGGLISKYALTYMENNNENHRTKLWVSFDSPHLGANIPLGDQHFLNYYASKLGGGGAKKGLAKLNTPAAKQMLVHHYSTGSQLPQAHIFRAGLLNNLHNLTPNSASPATDAMPSAQNLRKVAIVNGSQAGNLLYNPCEKAFSMDVALVRSKGVRVFLPLPALFFWALLAAPATARLPAPLLQYLTLISPQVMVIPARCLPVLTY